MIRQIPRIPAAVVRRRILSDAIISQLEQNRAGLTDDVLAAFCCRLLPGLQVSADEVVRARRKLRGLVRRGPVRVVGGKPGDAKRACVWVLTKG